MAICSILQDGEGFYGGNLPHPVKNESIFKIQGLNLPQPAKKKGSTKQSALSLDYNKKQAVDSWITGHSAMEKALTGYGQVHG